MSRREHSAQHEPDFAHVDGGVRARLLAELARIVPPAALLASAEDLKPYECDGLSAIVACRWPWCSPPATRPRRAAAL
jgi:glycolate oxidase